MIRLFRKTTFTAAVLTFGLMTSVAGFAAPEINLHHASDWARIEIFSAYENNLLTEAVLSNYKNNITREELSELSVKLYEALSGKNAPAATTNPFVDTNNPTIVSANILGIVNGIGNGKFAPNNTATREEVSVMLYRTIKAANPQMSMPDNNQNSFSDQAIISQWAQKAVGALHSANITSGIGNNRFHPRGQTSREEAITLVKRIYQKVSNNYVETDLAQYNLISRGEKRNKKIEELKSLLPKEMGKPYQWGGTGPNSYDCSGLVYTLYGKIGVSVPRVSAAQATAGTYVSRNDLQYGDLVFFARDGKNVNHVGIYVGNGEFVHAPSTGDVVKKSTIMTGYYNNCYYTARRVIQ